MSAKAWRVRIYGSIIVFAETEAEAAKTGTDGLQMYLSDLPDDGAFFLPSGSISASSVARAAGFDRTEPPDVLPDSKRGT